MRAPRAILTVVIVSAATVLSLIASAVRAQDSRVPWPGGEPPTASELDALLDEAGERATRERQEEFLEAQELGEQSEHVRVLESDVDAGKWDKAQLFRFGDGFFDHTFRAADGYGSKAGERLLRVHVGARGGLETFSCASCHSVGGPNGSGALTQNAFLDGDGRRLSSALARNPPALLGLGLVQALASEMTTQLQTLRDQALTRAQNEAHEVTVELVAKDVSFGKLRVRTDATLDTSGVQGIDADLVVRPFGWKGSQARLRRFAEEAARVHFGVQSHVLAMRSKDHPDPARLGDGKTWWDPDGDGVQRELEEGTLTALAVYFEMLEAPTILPPADASLRDRWSHGSALFDEVGCNACHRRELNLDFASWQEQPDTAGAPAVTIALLRDGDAPKGTNRVRLFSDLKRHAMGGALADARGGEGGLAPDVFLTRPLWGLAESAPYLHDGRAATIPDAILAHAGEAAKAKDAFARLSDSDQADLHIFLLSLTRAPKVKIVE